MRSTSSSGSSRPSRPSRPRSCWQARVLRVTTGRDYPLSGSSDRTLAQPNAASFARRLVLHVELVRPLRDRYVEWSTGVAADVPFYVGLAREADGLLVELAVGNGRALVIPLLRQRQAVGISRTLRRRCSRRLDCARLRRESSLDLREGDIRELEIDEPAALIYCPGGLCCICPPGPIVAAALSGSRRRFCLTAASPGMRSPSTITSHPP